MNASAAYQSSEEPEYGGSLSSVGELLGEISGDISTLMRQEVELAKTEIKDSVSKAGKGAGMLGGAAVAGHMVLLFLSVALWWALGTTSLGLGWSGLIVAVIWAIIAGVLAVVGRSQLKAVNGVPRTAETAKKIPDALKGNEDSR
jgi:phage-related minor tail protein